MKTRSGGKKAAPKVAASKPKAAAKRKAVKKEKSLFDRLGKDFPCAAVVKRFSDSLFANKVVGKNSKNPALAEWHKAMGETRLPGLVYLRTQWLEATAGGPCPYTGKSLRDAHMKFHITPAEFDAVAQELANSLDFYKVPATERAQVLSAFNAQKDDVTAGSRTK